jgi:integrating conjugative element protein (TIGR03756 family)
MIKRVLCYAIFLMVNIVHAGNNNINSVSITKATLTALPSCLHYQIPTHFCIWVSELGEVNVTPIVSHYLPDVVISVFNKPHDNPWLEINKILDSVSQPIQNQLVKDVTGIAAGSGSHSFETENEQNVIFKEADIVGNPALTLIPNHGLLHSTATPFIPYFQSMLDSLQWRGLPPASLPEEALALIFNVQHHIGKGLTNWGGIYPHEGKVANDNDMKAAAVIAERAGDLITNPANLGHIFKSLSTKCGEHCSAAPIQENSKETYFQMIYPITQNECHILGESNSYDPTMLNSEGSYTWVVWRHYSGCADGEGVYVGRT